MNYKLKENKKSWTVSTKKNNVTVTININKDICPTRKDVEKHLKITQYAIGGNEDGE